MPPDDQPQPFVERRRFSRIQVLEATAASLMAAAILGTAGGMGWIVMVLPDDLRELRAQITQILKNQDALGERFNEIEKVVNEHDRRIIRLELNR